MKIFNDSAYINPNVAASRYRITMDRTHPDHLGPMKSPYTGSGKNVLRLLDTIKSEDPVGAGTFKTAMLQALDKVSGAQQKVSALTEQAIIDPDSVDIHDITIAQAEASMSLDITRRVLNSLVQGWKELINTR